LTKTIAERLAGAALALALSGAAAAAPTAPPPPKGLSPEYESAQRLFLRAGRFQPLAEAAQRWQYDHRVPYRSATLGTYARVARPLKVGAFYKLQYGARHDDDWGPLYDSGAGSDWGWQNVSYRPESLLLLDVFPRMELPFLGEGWVGSMRMRFEHNWFNGQNVLRLEPEISYFWMNGLTPLATFVARHETALALNFGQRRVWQRWHYVSGLWHARTWLSLGPSLGIREEVWSTSTSFSSELPGRTYQTLFRAWVLGFNVAARLN
jgi:hypothetical protein